MIVIYFFNKLEQSNAPQLTAEFLKIVYYTIALNMNTQHDYGKSSYIKSKKFGIGRNTASDNNNVWK